MKTNILKIIFLGAVALFAFGAEANSQYYAGSTCSFYRDLTLGSRGEDVRCLQQYLNNGGFNTSFYQYSYPDGVFGPLTRQAVMSWQATYGLPGFGYFDATSRAKYYELMGGVGGIGNGDYYGGTYYDNGYYGGGVVTNPVYPVYGINSEEERARMRINDALIMIDDAEDEIDDSNENTNSAENSLEDAKEDMEDAIWAFFVDRDYAEAYDKADDAFQNAEDAYDDAGGDDGDREDARDAINDAQDAIDDARDEIEDADDDGADVDDAEDLLDDAEDRLDDARDEYDDEDYDHAEELANDAEDLAQDAIDAIDW